MMSLAEQFVTFAETGNQQQFSLVDGRVFKGWIMEISDTELLMSTGAGEQGQEVWLSLTDINPATLSYWDVKQQQWLAYTLN